MAIVAQNLFTWQEVSAKSDLDRLELVINTLPDEGLMKILEKERDKGRDDYPIRAVWNSILAGIVYQHQSIESLMRELSRNGELRDACGFDLILGQDAVPTPRAYSHFLRKMIRPFPYEE